MVTEEELPSIHPNVLTAGEDLLIHEQVRGVGLGLGIEKHLCGAAPLAFPCTTPL